MSAIVYDLNQLYRQTFGGKPFVIQGINEQLTQIKGSSLTADYLGKAIWLPVRFVNLDSRVFGQTDLLLPYAVIEIDLSKSITKTSLPERGGTVKELYSIDDYDISLKGFLIDESRVWPEKELEILNKLWKLSEAIKIDNALTDVFLESDTLVVIEKLKFPAVENGMKHIRPFSMKLISDSVFTLDA